MSAAEAEALKARGDELSVSDPDAALAAYRQAVELAPDYFQAWANLGNLHVAVGAYADAAEAYRRAIGARPDIAELHDNLGNVLRQRGDLDAALAAHDRALALKPELPGAHLNRAVVLRSMGYLEAALASADEAAVLVSGHPVIHYNRGLILQGMGRWEEAAEDYRRALESAPGMVEVRFAQVGLDILQGDKGSARRRLDGLRAEHEPDLGWQLLNARLAADAGERESAIHGLSAALDSGHAVSAEAARRAHFTLADLLDRQGRFDAAFAHYAAANRLNPGYFDRAGHIRRSDELMAAYRRSAGVVGGNAAEAPVFIVGMPRSGTSLVEQILASHSQVWGGGEREGMFDLLASVGALGRPLATAELSAADLTELATDYLRDWQAEAGEALRVTDKLPANFEQLGLIARLFPRARIIHCVRDPADTGLSCYFQDFAGGNPWSDDLTDIAHYYRDYRRVMGFWAEHLPLRMLTVRYQDVVDDIETEARRMLDFLDLEWEPACLAFHESRRRARTASNEQVDQPIYRRALERWRHYAPHVPELLALRDEYPNQG